jgi:hypothetical protein
MENVCMKKFRNFYALCHFYAFCQKGLDTEDKLGVLFRSCHNLEFWLFPNLGF